MPGYDGTGPNGEGPRTGRGFGWCSMLTKRHKGKVFMSLFIPAVAAIVNDVRKPDSVTRRLYSSVKTRFTKKLLSGMEKDLEVHITPDKELKEKKI